MKKPYSKILSQEEIATKFDQMEKTDGDKSHLYAENVFVLESFRPKSWELFKQAQLLDRSEVHIVNILGDRGLEVAIPSMCKPGDVTYVVISRETERFVNEIHTHEAETRPSGEPSENLQESKESMSYKQREVNTSPKETWVASSTGGAGAGFLNLVPNKASIEPRNEKKWITIHAYPKRGRDLAISISKTVTTMLRHFDQDERGSDGPRHWEAIKYVLLR